MERNLLLLVLVVGYLGLVGCIPSSYNSYPTSSITTSKYDRPRNTYSFNIDTTKSVYTDKDITLQISPSQDEYGRVLGFNLEISNKTNNDILVNWADVYFLALDKPDGGFMFSGVTYSRRDEPKQSFIIMPKSTNDIAIYPNSHVMYIKQEVIDYSREFFDEYRYAGWNHIKLQGRVGVYARLKVNGKEKSIKVSMDILPA